MTTKSIGSRAICMTAALFLFLPMCPEAGNAEEKTVVVNGKSLKLLGTGLREFLFIDIYALSAYSESGACTPTEIVYNNETKAMHLKMIRDIPVDRLTDNLKSTFEDNMPKKGDLEALKKKVDTFLSYFKKDLTKGTVVEISYVPGRGTVATRNGKAIGPATRGKDFGELIWRSYFGSNTCCSGLKASIIKACKSGGN